MQLDPMIQTELIRRLAQLQHWGTASRLIQLTQPTAIWPFVGWTPARQIRMYDHTMAEFGLDLRDRRALLPPHDDDDDDALNQGVLR